MQILLSCLQDLRDHSIPAYKFWAPVFRNGLSESAHRWLEVPGVDWAEGCTHRASEERKIWLERTWTTSLAWINKQLRGGQRIDVFLSYLYPQQIDVTAINEIRRLGIPCVNFFCDNVREFSKIPAEYDCFDLHWVPEFEALRMYWDAGLKVVHAPMPAWIPTNLRTIPERELHGPTFIGSHDRLRQDLLGRAIKFGASITVRGPGWQVPGEIPSRSCSDTVVGHRLRQFRNQFEFIKDHGALQWMNKLRGDSLPHDCAEMPQSSIAPAVWGDDYVRITRESEVTLGINRVPTFRANWRNPLAYSRLRDIEAPMMGACYLTEWTEGLTKLYDVGIEIDTYRSAEEMALKLKELQADPKKRNSLRRMAQRRALSDLSVGNTIAKIFAALGLNP